MRCAGDGRHEHPCGNHFGSHFGRHFGRHFAINGAAMEAAKAVDGLAGRVVGGAAFRAESADVSRRSVAGRERSEQMERGWTSRCIPCVAIDHAECSSLKPGEPLGFTDLCARLSWLRAVVVSPPSASAGVGSCGGGGPAVCLPLFSRKFIVLV